MTNCEKLLERWEYQTILPVSWETCTQGQEATVRTLYGTTDWFKMEKVQEGCLPLLYLFNLYTEHIMRNARLDDLQVGIKTGSRNSNNFWYVGDTTLMEENKELLKNLLRRVKEESERAGFKKTKN